MRPYSRSPFLALLLVSGLSAAAPALAHTRMIPNAQIVPRSDRDNGKSAPCGGDAKTAAKTFGPGSSVRIDWEETIDHPGRYEIHFSPNGTDFSTVLHTEPDVAGKHAYSAVVQLPMAPCDNCVVQLVQVMTDRSPPTNYYICADVKIVNAMTAATAAPTPAATVGTSVPRATASPGSAGTPPSTGSPGTATPTAAPAAVTAPKNLRIEWRKEAP